MDEVSVDDLEQLMADGAFVVDVREPDEYSAGHVPGAVNVPLGDVGLRLPECLSPSGVTYMICRSGARSARACEVLIDAGHRAVNVAGGTLAWTSSGRSVVEGASPT